MKYRGIEHERTEDAPFVGALLCAADCKLNCDGCFNQHLKQSALLDDLHINIINEVLTNPFNEGIILGGLEWSHQPHDMYILTRMALEADLKVMIYSGLTEAEFFSCAPAMKLLDCIMYKFGRYEKDKEPKVEHGIILASDNQIIKEAI